MFAVRMCLLLLLLLVYSRADVLTKPLTPLETSHYHTVQLSKVTNYTYVKTIGEPRCCTDLVCTFSLQGYEPLDSSLDKYYHALLLEQDSFNFGGGYTWDQYLDNRYVADVSRFTFHGPTSHCDGETRSTGYTFSFAGPLSVSRGLQRYFDAIINNPTYPFMDFENYSDAIKMYYYMQPTAVTGTSDNFRVMFGASLHYAGEGLASDRYSPLVAYMTVYCDMAMVCPGGSYSRFSPQVPAALSCEYYLDYDKCPEGSRFLSLLNKFI